MSLILPCIRAWSFSPHKNHVYYTEAGREVRQVQLKRRYPLRWFMGGQVRVTGETKRGRWSDGLTLYPTFCHFPLPFPAFPMGSRPSSNSIRLLHLLAGSLYYVTVACFSIISLFLLSTRVMPQPEGATRQLHWLAFFRSTHSVYHVDSLVAITKATMV